MVSHNSAGGYAGAGSRLRKTLASGLAIAACFSSPVYAGTTSYSYDTLGRVKTVSFPDGTAFSYTYDAAGNRIQSVSTRGFTPPTATADSVTTAYNTALTFDPRSNDSSLYGSGLTITAVGTPSHGSVTNNSGTGLTYTPTSGYYGSDSFTYTISDGYNTATATVSVTVSVPPAPSVSAQSLSVAYNTAGTVSLTPSGVYTSVSAATGPSHGAVSISGTTATYTPTSGYYGSDSFTYTGTGPGGTSAPATVSITVASPSAPTVSNASLSSAYNTAGTVNLTIGGVYTSAAVATTPAHGTASISGATATYTPTNGYYGSDSFTYTATGPGGTSAPATVSVTVATPPAPTVSGKSLLSSIEN